MAKAGQCQPSRVLFSVVNPTNSDTPPTSTRRGRASPSKDRLFTLLDAISDGVCVYDKDMIVVFVNKTLRAIVGDVAGRKCTDTALSSESICKVCPLKIGWNYDEGPFRREAADTGGRLYEIVVTKITDPDDGVDYWVSVERDITERSQTERKLQTLMTSIDQMADAVCVSDLEGKVIYINKAYVHLTGYDDKSVASLSMTDITGGVYSGATMQTIMKAAAERGWSGEMTGLRKDGSRYYANVDAKPVRDERGLAIAVVGILRDITKQRSEKVEHEKYTSELESKMEARTTELARRVSQLMTINKISRVVTSIMDTNELMSEFVKSIAQGFSYPYVILMMMDKEKGDLYLKSVFGRDIEQIPADMRIKLKEGIIGHAAYFGETLVSGNVETDARYIRKYLIGTKSELAVPVTFRGEILGILDVQSEVRDAFTRNDVNILEMLADMLANSITNAKAYTEAREREAALSVLDRISKQISYRLEPSVVLDQVARDAATLLQAEKAMVGLLDEATNSISWLAPYHIDKQKIKGFKFSADRGVTGRALKLLKTEMSNDYSSDPDSSDRDADLFDIKSIISAPMIVEGRGIGTINVYNKTGGRGFTKSDALFLSSLADHAAIALENANLVSSLNQRVHSQLALLDTALSMQRQIESGSIYEIVATKLKEVVWNDEITFYIADHQRGVLVPVFSRGPYTEQIMADTALIGTGITGHVARTGRAELVNDTMADPRTIDVPGTPVKHKEALMAIPLIGKEQVIGVLAMYRDNGPIFTDAEFEIARLFASQAAVAVENTALYRARESLLADSKRKVEQMAKVLELTTSVMYMDDLDKLLQRVTDVVVQSFGFKRASAGFLDIEHDTFIHKAASGYPAWIKMRTVRPAKNIICDMEDRFKIGNSSYYRKYEDQDYGVEAFEYLANPELSDKPRASPDAWHERDILMSVFKDRSGRLTGYLLVDEPADWKIPTVGQIEVIEILAGIASIAVENTKTYEKQVMAANEIALLNDLMTHDINNFNQGIMGYIELLLEDKRLDVGQRRYAERALAQVRNNARLIDNIRKLAKIRMLEDSELVPMDIQKAVTEAITYVTSMAAPDRKVNITCQMLHETHFVMANQFLNDLFQNLLSNSLKFDGSKRVRVDVTISEDVATHGSYWIVSVIDRGRGIPDDRKTVVFERFATGMTGIKGFGLGLSIVKSIVDKFGGRIWVEDRVSGDYTKGTVFKIKLPKAPTSSSSSGKIPEPPSQEPDEEATDA
jgi:PAS domain S-box-containing protein